VPGRDLFAQAWYQGGISVVDFTDSARPVEIAFFDLGPISADELVHGGFWSAYWYNGRIYGTEIARGLDVFALTPSEHLTVNEIAAAALANQGERFNPQQQFPVTWPDHPIVALAYVDQLNRIKGVDPQTIAALSQSLTEAGQRVGSGRRDPALAGRLTALAGNLGPARTDPEVERRIAALRSTLAGIAAALR
jgi:hypothetical protein